MLLPCCRGVEFKAPNAMARLSRVSISHFLSAVVLPILKKLHLVIAFLLLLPDYCCSFVVRRSAMHHQSGRHRAGGRSASGSSSSWSWLLIWVPMVLLVLTSLYITSRLSIVQQQLLDRYHNHRGLRAANIHEVSKHRPKAPLHRLVGDINTINNIGTDVGDRLQVDNQVVADDGDGFSIDSNRDEMMQDLAELAINQLHDESNLIVNSIHTYQPQHQQNHDVEHQHVEHVERPVDVAASTSSKQTDRYNKPLSSYPLVEPEMKPQRLPSNCEGDRSVCASQTQTTRFSDQQARKR
jgi:hypothetical protein